MKPKNFILIVLVAALMGLGLWWFVRSTASAPEKTAKAEVPALGNVEAPKQISPPTIAPPVAPPALKPGVAPVAATPPAEANADLQADLKTAIPDIARLTRAGGQMMALQTYSTPDDLAQIDPSMMQQAQAAAARIGQTPAGQKMREAFAQSYEALENQTPTSNAAGDEATYMYMRPSVSDMENGVATGAGTPTPWSLSKSMASGI